MTNRPQQTVLDGLRPLGFSGRGGPTPEMLAKANAAIDKMTADYPTWAIKDVDRLGDVIASLPVQPQDPERLQEAYKLAHDMRGQGGSFGYPVVTGIAGSFCKFVKSLEQIDGPAVEILQAHVKSLRAVLSNGITGDGGPMGTKILDGLDRAVARYHERRGGS